MPTFMWPFPKLEAKGIQYMGVFDGCGYRSPLQLFRGSWQIYFEMMLRVAMAVAAAVLVGMAVVVAMATSALLGNPKP